MNQELHELKEEMAEKLKIGSEKMEIISDIAQNSKLGHLFYGISEKFVEKLVFEGLKNRIEKEEMKQGKSEIRVKEGEFSEKFMRDHLKWKRRKRT